MTTPARMAVAAALALGVIVGVRLTERRSVHAAPPAPPVASPSSTPLRVVDPEARTADLKRFIELLGGFRGGDAAARTELFAVAERLCADHGRCDPLDVARYYAALTAGEREQGLADEREYAGQWRRVRRASREGVHGNEWRALREDILAELAEFSATVLARPDFVPAGRALSLRARLSVERLENDPLLGERARAELTRQSVADARRSIAVFERAGQVTPRLEPLWLLGRLDRLRGDLAGARSWFRRCLDASRAVNNEDFREHALQGLVAVARALGDVRAMDRLLAEIATFRSPTESWLLAREHGSRLLHEDHPEEALEFLLRHAPLEPVYRIEWHLLVGSAFLRAGDVAAARRQFDALGTDRMTETTLLARATVDLREGRHQEVVDTLESPALFAVMTPKSQAEALVLLGEALLGTGDAEGALEPLEGALEIAASWSEHTLPSEPGGGSVIGEWLGLHAVVLLAQALVRLDDSLEAARVIEDHQSRSLRLAGGEGATTVTAEHLERWAASTELGLVTWVVGADSGVVAHVAPNGAALAAELPVGRKTVLRGVRRVREAILTDDPTRARRVAEELLDVLLPHAVREHAREHATAGSDPRLLLLLHGPLEALPVEFLADASFGAVPLVLPGLPATGDPGPWSPPTAAWRLLGNPLAADGRALLPGTASELDAIARLYPDAELSAGSDFDRARLEAALLGSAPVHLATHLLRECGTPSARLAGVGLQLSDGDCLSTADIERLAPRLPLVVLAACETGGGDFVDAEGLMGLARGFLESGTGDLLVTSWPVEDRAALRFSELFHEHLVRGAEPSRAAHRARAGLRDEGWLAAEWAAFRLLGRH